MTLPNATLFPQALLPLYIFEPRYRQMLADALHSSGRTLILCGAREQPARLMHQAEFERHVGRKNICANIKEALERAGEVSGPAVAALSSR